MLVYRDHPRTGAAHVAHVVYVTGASVAGGSGAVFALILVAAIVGEEAFRAPFDDALDPIFRQSIGLVSLVLGAALGLAAFGLAFRRTATARQLARAATERPDEVATWADRQDIEAPMPFLVVYYYGFFLAGLVLLALIAFAFALPETFRYNPESAVGALPIIGAVIVVGVVDLLLLAVTRWVLTPRWRDATATVTAVWNQPMRERVTKAERAARPRDETVDFGTAHRVFAWIGRRIGLAAIPVGGVGLVLFGIGVYARQPCRNCDPRYFDEPIETLIDIVVVIGGPLIGLCALMALIGLVGEWLARVSEVAQLRLLAADRGPSPKSAQLLPHLVGRGPAELLGIALIVAGWSAVAPLAVARALNGAPIFGTLVIILTTLGFVGVLVLAWSVPVDDAVRNELRAAWSPGDPVPPKPDVRRRTARARDAGDGWDGIPDS